METDFTADLGKIVRHAESVGFIVGMSFGKSMLEVVKCRPAHDDSCTRVVDQNRHGAPSLGCPVILWPLMKLLRELQHDLSSSKYHIQYS